MEFGFILFAFIAFMVFRAIRQGVRSMGDEVQRQMRQAGGLSASPEQLMRELARVLDERQQADHPKTVRLPPKRMVASRPQARPQPIPRSAPPVAPARAPAPRIKGEEARSLEVIVDEGTSQDAEAEAIVAKRRQEVERRNVELAGEHHEAFHRKLVATAGQAGGSSGRNRVQRLRQAVIWQEVLGRPVAER